MRPDLERVVILTHGNPSVGAEALGQTLSLLRERSIDVVVPPSEMDKHGALLNSAGFVSLMRTPDDLEGVGMCLVLGGDGTMLRGFHLTRDHGIPVAGVNLGRVGFLTTVRSDELRSGIDQLLDGDFETFPLLSLEAELGGTVFRATNDVVVDKGDSPHACSLALIINGVTMFEVLCDGVVVGTPAGSSAYSLAAGGPLLGISVDAYIISLIAPHAVGVRPVVAAPGDVLEIVNTAEDFDCYVDVDGQRLAALLPQATLRIRAKEDSASLVLLTGDSLYHHFRDRLL